MRRRPRIPPNRRTQGGFFSQLIGAASSIFGGGGGSFLSTLLPGLIGGGASAGLGYFANEQAGEAAREAGELVATEYEEGAGRVRRGTREARKVATRGRNRALEQSRGGERRAIAAQRSGERQAARDATKGINALRAGVDAVAENEAERNAMVREDRERILADIAPFVQAGKEAITRLSENIGEFTRGFSRDDFQVDPGYEFRKAEGERAIRNALISQGRGGGGQLFTELAEFNSNLASDEYQRAFERFQLEQGNAFGRNLSLATIGGNLATTRGPVIDPTRLGDAYARLAGGFSERAGIRERGGATRAGIRERGGRDRSGIFLSTASDNANRITSGVEQVNALLGGAARARAGGITGQAEGFLDALSSVNNGVQGGLNAFLLSTILNDRQNQTPTGAPAPVS